MWDDPCVTLHKRLLHAFWGGVVAGAYGGLIMGLLAASLVHAWVTLHP